MPFLPNLHSFFPFFPDSNLLPHSVLSIYTAATREELLPAKQWFLNLNCTLGDFKTTQGALNSPQGQQHPRLRMGCCQVC